MKAAAISLLCLLTGCASTFDSERPLADEYSLKTTIDRAELATTTPLSAPIQLMRIEAAPGYDTRSILVTQPDGRLDVLANARWVGSIPSLLEVAVVDQLRAAGFDAHADSAALAAPYTLRMIVRRFDAEYTTAGDSDQAAQPTIRVDLDVSLIRRRDRLPMGTWRVSGAAVAAENRRVAIVSAFGSATRLALEGLSGELSAVTALKQ
jgi:ABC-type uncharacterized transport system auxiliary subunit